MEASSWGFPTAPEIVAGKLGSACGGNWSWDDNDNLLQATGCLNDPFDATGDRTIQFEASYDELQRLETSARNSQEPTTTSAYVTRDFNFFNAPELTEYIGPDGEETVAIRDTVGRIESIERDSGGVVWFTYDEANRLIRRDNFSPTQGTQTHYGYDDANRLTSIHHKIIDGDTILKLVYTHTPDGLIDTITEYEDNTSTPTAVVSFEYDNLNRLTHETRESSTAPYDLHYEYDPGGNRTRKIDEYNGLETLYTYDVDDPDSYGSNDNRLLKYEVRDLSTEDLIETVWYAYYVTDASSPATGHVQQIVRKAEGDPVYHRTWFNFDQQGRVWMTVRDQWELDGSNVTDFLRLSAREFRYDSGRQRYLMRDRDLGDTDNANDNTALGLLDPDGEGEELPHPARGLWTDYIGETAYADYELNPADPPGADYARASHQPGLWQREIPAVGDPTLSVFHSDQIGTTRALSDSDDPPTVTHRAIYTAFGELVHESGAIGTRYGYAGAWGYEAKSVWGDSANDPGLVHVGERVYDPAIGRFIQRDPIGIRGGTNGYSYCSNNPMLWIDPQGLAAESSGTRNRVLLIGGAVVAAIGSSVIIDRAAAWYYDTMQEGLQNKVKALGLEDMVKKAGNDLAGSCNLTLKWYRVPPEYLPQSGTFADVVFMPMESGKVSVMGTSNGETFQTYLQDWHGWGWDVKVQH